MLASLLEIRANPELLERTKGVLGTPSENKTRRRDLYFRESYIFPQTPCRKHKMEKCILLLSLLCTVKGKSRTISDSSGCDLGKCFIGFFIDSEVRFLDQKVDKENFSRW